MRRTRIIIVLLALACTLPFALAANNPGHDTLYIEQTGDSQLSGTLNITSNLSIIGQTTTGPLVIYGDGSTPAAGTFISSAAGGTDWLRINTPNRLYLKPIGGDQITVGGSTATDLNVTGTIFQNSVRLCLANGTNCVGYNNGTGNVSGAGASGRVAYWSGASVLTSNSGFTFSGTDLTLPGDINTPATFYIGNSASATGTSAIAIGEFAAANSDYGMALGWGSWAQGPNSSSFALGPSATANGTYASAIGGGASAKGLYALAIGYSIVNAAYGLGIGSDTNVAHANSVAIGRNATTTATNQLMVGASTVNLNAFVYGNLNVSAGKDICISGGQCLSSASSGGSGGWTNTTTLITSNAGVNITMDAGVLFVDGSNNRVGVGNTLPNYTLHVVGNENVVGGLFNNGTQVCTSANGLCSAAAETDPTWTANYTTFTTRDGYLNLTKGYAGTTTVCGAGTHIANFTIWNNTAPTITCTADGGSTPTLGAVLTAGNIASGDIDMNNTKLLLNIGSPNTDFTSNGGLTLAGTLNVGSNTLFANTTHVGIGTATPQGKLSVDLGTTAGTALRINATANDAMSIPTVKIIQGIDNDALNIYHYDNIAISLRTIEDGSGSIYVNNATGSSKAVLESYTSGNYGTLSLANQTNGNTVFLTADSSSNSYFLGGNVGIGTASPSHALTVGSGTTSSVNVNTMIIATGNNNPRIGSVVDNTGAFLMFDRVTASAQLFGYNYTATASTPLAFQIPGGNVGIGTTGPDAKLDSLATTTQLRLTYTDGSIYTDFTTNSNGYLNIAPSGKRVGIGQATSPTYVLEVGNGSSTTTPLFGVYQLSSGDSSMAFAHSVASQSYAIGMDYSDAEKFKISTAASATGAALGTGDLLTITPTGYVGIGTAAPNASLHINSNNAAGILHLQNTSGTTALFVNGSNRYVGIGTKTPLTQFHINGGTVIHTTTDFVGGSVGSELGGWFTSPSGNTSYNLAVYNAGGATYGNLILQGSGGYVGIGQTSPAYRLDVATTLSGASTGASTAGINNALNRAYTSGSAGGIIGGMFMTLTDSTGPSGLSNQILRLSYNRNNPNLTSAYDVGVVSFTQVTAGNGGTFYNYMADGAIISAGINLTNNIGYFASDSTGSGTLASQYGVYINSLTKATTNYAIYTAGSTPSYFGGNVTVGTAASANPTANSCIIMPGGGKICGNSTCVVIYSPNGASTTQVCN